MTTKTYGTNYNGTQLWARVYLPHGALGTNAANIGEQVRELITGSEMPVIGLAHWRMDYNQNGVYFETRMSLESKTGLEAMGFKASKSAA